MTAFTPLLHMPTTKETDMPNATPNLLDEAPGPIIRVFRRDTGWTMADPAPEPCTSNFHREQDGRPACTATAVWKVVEDHGLHLSIGFYCDTDLPEEHKPQAAILRDPDSARYPTQITVFCDHCGREHTGDYLVSDDMGQAERLAVARKHLVEKEGWEHDKFGDDFCPEHAAPAAAPAAAHVEETDRA